MTAWPARSIAFFRASGDAMQTLSEIRFLLESRGLSPRHALGQNFLIDHNLIRKLVDTSGVAQGDVVLEIGPGTGTMTEELLDRGCQVIACELDPGLGELLASTLGARITLIRGDCLASKSAMNPEIIDALAGRAFTLVSNLPYGAASPLMVTLLTRHPECRGMFVTIQREVGERLRAAPGGKDYGELGVIAQSLAHIERIAVLPGACFWPRPKVESEMVSITRRQTPLTSDPASLARMCRVLFTKRRKQVGAILGRDFHFPGDIDPSARPESLSVEQIDALAQRAPTTD